MSLVVEGENGSITVPDAVLVGIAVRAAERVDGIHVRRRRTVDVEERVVRLAVSVRRGESLRELAEHAQDEVRAALEAMCGIEAKVDIAIGELR